MYIVAKNIGFIALSRVKLRLKGSLVYHRPFDCAKVLSVTVHGTWKHFLWEFYGHRRLIGECFCFRHRIEGKSFALNSSDASCLNTSLVIFLSPSSRHFQASSRIQLIFSTPQTRRIRKFTGTIRSELHRWMFLVHGLMWRFSGEIYRLENQSAQPTQRRVLKP